MKYRGDFCRLLCPHYLQLIFDNFLKGIDTKYALPPRTTSELAPSFTMHKSLRYYQANTF